MVMDITEAWEAWYVRGPMMVFASLMMAFPTAHTCSSFSLIFSTDHIPLCTQFRIAFVSFLATFRRPCRRSSPIDLTLIPACHVASSFAGMSCPVGLT
jgi:hypothetical protein